MELRALYEYAARLLAVSSASDARSVRATRPPSLGFPAPGGTATATLESTAAQAERRRVLVPHPRVNVGPQGMSSEEVYAQLSGFAAGCSIGAGDISEAASTRPPMSPREAQLGLVYDEILLLLDESCAAGRFALVDSLRGWEGIWPKLEEGCRARLGELFAQKSELLFELQGELNIPFCDCPIDAPGVPKEWAYTVV